MKKIITLLVSTCLLAGVGYSAKDKDYNSGIKKHNTVKQQSKDKLGLNVITANGMQEKATKVTGPDFDVDIFGFGNEKYYNVNHHYLAWHLEDTYTEEENGVTYVPIKDTGFFTIFIHRYHQDTTFIARPEEMRISNSSGLTFHIYLSKSHNARVNMCIPNGSEDGSKNKLIRTKDLAADINTLAKFCRGTFDFANQSFYLEVREGVSTDKPVHEWCPGKGVNLLDVAHRSEVKETSTDCSKA